MTINAKDITMKAVSGGVLTQPDNVPDQFTFVDQTGVPLSTQVESAPIVLQGMDAFAQGSISVDIGQYQVNGGAWTGVPGTVGGGSTVRARHTSSPLNNTPTNQILTVSGVADTFTLTTLSGGATVDWDLLYTNAFVANTPGNVYWLDPLNGSNGNTGANKGQAFLTLAFALSQMVGGDELIIADGSYVANVGSGFDLLFSRRTIPSGSAGAYTVIRAETPMGVRIEASGTQVFGDSLIHTGGGSYKWIDGIVAVHKGGSDTPEAANILDGTRNRITRAIMRREQPNFSTPYDINIAVGGNQCLLQDVALCGSGRYQSQNGGDSDCVFRRVVGRLDYHNTSNPSATFINYSATDFVFQNVLGVDSNKVSGGGEITYAVFYDRQFGTRNKYRGSIALNCDIDSASVGALHNEGFNGNNLEWTNCIAWGNTWTGFEDEAGPGNSLNDSLTLGQNGNTNFSGYNNPTNSRISNVAPPNILNNTPGAVVLFAHGGFLTHFGDSGYDTLTADRLWPWPYEGSIRTVFSETINAPAGAIPSNPVAQRGFCSDAIAGSLTEYLFTQGTDPWNNGQAVNDIYS